MLFLCSLGFRSPLPSFLQLTSQSTTVLIPTSLWHPSDCPRVFHIAAAPCGVFLTLGPIGQAVWRWDVLRKHTRSAVCLCDVSSPFMLEILWSLQTGGFRVLQCLRLQRCFLPLTLRTQRRVVQDQAFVILFHQPLVPKRVIYLQNSQLD